MNQIAGVNVIVSPGLPLEPTLEQDVIRQVRHGLRNVLEWMGEDVGPKPGAKTHAIITSDAGHNPTMFVSQAHYDQLKAEATYDT